MANGKNKVRQAIIDSRGEVSTWAETVVDPFKHSSPLGYGSLRPTTVSKVMSRTVVSNTGSNKNLCIALQPNYVYANSTAGSPGFYGECASSSDTVTLNIVASAWQTIHNGLYDVRMVACGYKIRFLGTEVNRGGRCGILDIPTRYPLGVTDTIKPNEVFNCPVTREHPITEGTFVQGFITPKSKSGVKRWNSTSRSGMEAREDTAQGWGSTVIAIDSATAAQSYEIEVVGIFECGAHLDLTTPSFFSVPAGSLRARPTCPSLDVVPHVAAEHSNHPAVHASLLDKVSSFAREAVKRVGSLWQGSSTFRNVVQYGVNRLAGLAATRLPLLMPPV